MTQRKLDVSQGEITHTRSVQAVIQTETHPTDMKKEIPWKICKHSIKKRDN